MDVSKEDIKNLLKKIVIEYIKYRDQPGPYDIMDIQDIKGKHHRFNVQRELRTNFNLLLELCQNEPQYATMIMRSEGLKHFLEKRFPSSFIPTPKSTDIVDSLIGAFGGSVAGLVTNIFAAVGMISVELTLDIMYGGFFKTLFKLIVTPFALVINAISYLIGGLLYPLTDEIFSAAKTITKKYTQPLLTDIYYDAIRPYVVQALLPLVQFCRGLVIGWKTGCSTRLFNDLFDIIRIDVSTASSLLSHGGLQDDPETHLYTAHEANLFGDYPLNLLNYWGPIENFADIDMRNNAMPSDSVRAIEDSDSKRNGDDRNDNVQRWVKVTEPGSMAKSESSRLLNSNTPRSDTNVSRASQSSSSSTPSYGAL